MVKSYEAVLHLEALFKPSCCLSCYVAETSSVETVTMVSNSGGALESAANVEYMSVRLVCLPSQVHYGRLHLSRQLKLPLTLRVAPLI